MKSLQNPNLEKHHKNLFISLITAMVLALVGCKSSPSKPQTTEIVSFHLASRSATYRPNSDPLIAARLNAPYFYHWLAEEQKRDAGLKSLLQVQGIVGDSHFLNYSEWLTKSGKILIRPNDPDDYGHGPLIAEIMRFSTVALAAGYNLSAQELVEAYLQGLAGKPAIAPSEVQKVEKMTVAQYEKAQQKYRRSLHTMHDGYHVWTKKAKIIPMSDAPEDLKVFFLSVKKDFDEWLIQNQFTALADGFSIKRDGGSAGYPRFQFLVEDPQKEIRVIEFKYEPQIPAVGLFKTEQLPFEKRLDLVEQYAIGTFVGSTYDAIEVQHDKTMSQFYIREKLKTFYDIEEISDEASVRKNILYLARQIGYWSSLFQASNAEAFKKQFLTPNRQQTTKQKIVSTIEKFNQSIPR